jgi:uncharacterized membrane protein YGL010W
MKKDLRRAFDERLKYYRSRHKTVGCKITHMVGVPMIALSFPIALFNRRLAAQFQVIGWFLQFTGHYVFEHNQPVFLDARDPLTAAVALVFVVNEWNRALFVETKKMPALPLKAMPDSSLN